MKPIRLIFKFAHNYIWQLQVTVLSMLALVGLQLLVPWLIKTLIETVSGTGSSPDANALITKLSLGVLGIFVVRAIFQFLRSYVAHIAGWGVVADLRKYIYEHLQRLSLRFYEDKQIGQLMSQVVNDSDLFEMLIAHAVPDVLVNILTLAGVIVVLVSLNGQLLLLSLLPVPLIILSLRIYARFVRPAFRHRQKELGDLNALLNENIAGIREIKAFNREEDELTRVGVRIDRYRISLLHALKLMAVFSPFIEFSSAVGTLVVIFFGGRLALQGILPVGDLVAFFLYLEILYQPIRSLSGAWENVQAALAGADRLSDLLEEDPEPEPTKNPLVLPARAKGDIHFQDVTFAYIEGENVLENIDLHVPAQSVIALVGPTGVGKSTLASLVPRFYDPTLGTITLDGHDIRTLSLENLRKQISIVLQDVYLFYGSVRDNILFGNQDATEEEVIAAAKVANAHHFIESLPNGYDTMIGERGVKLSGGQKQRISIARAVLKNAPILILDEATSSVDMETELAIQQALERLIVGRTTIIIAHRLSTIRNADKIVVLEGKRIAETGNHTELMAQDGLYKRLYTVQQHYTTHLSRTHIN